jgi:hypothetical protein
VLQLNLSSRSGDIALSRGDTVEYMRWRDLVKKLSDHDDGFDGVQLTCTLRFVKKPSKLTCTLRFEKSEPVCSYIQHSS